MHVIHFIFFFFGQISRKNVPIKRKENHPNLFFVNKELPLDDTFGSPYYYSGKREMRARQAQDARITIITPNNSSTHMFIH